MSKQLTKFGITEEDQQALLNSFKRNRVVFKNAHYEHLRNRYPKVSPEDTEIAVKLLSSPARNSFTAFDVHNALMKLNS
jgi:hypothetical protein